MKPFIITISDVEDSVNAAQRCIDSAKKFGIDVEIFEAYTPKDKPFDVFKKLGVKLSDRIYKNPHLRNLDAQCASVLSHYFLWQKAIDLNESILVLEHDAIFVDKLPDIKDYLLVNLAKPSFGKYQTPRNGLHPFPNPHLKGAHGYAISPAGAKRIMESINKNGIWAGADVFLNFRWMQEYAPWPIEAKPEFTTIQYTADKDGITKIIKQ